MAGTLAHMAIMIFPPALYVFLVRRRLNNFLISYSFLLVFMAVLFLNPASWNFSVLFLMAGVFAFFRANRGWEDVSFGLEWKGWLPLGRGLAGGVLLAVVYLAINGELLQRMAELAGHFSLSPFLAVVLATTVPAVGEELFFRGVLQEELGRVTGSTTITVLLVAGLFSLYHLDRLEIMSWPAFLTYLGFLFTGSLLMSWLRNRDNLLAAMAFHLAYNLVV